MPKLLERSGTSDKGSITGIYTILVDGDDMDEPVADTVRGILDGHIVLSRKLAQAYHSPAIDVLKSVSRLTGAVSGAETKKAMGYARKVMATWEENEDMVTIGAYVKGSSAAVDEAIEKRQPIEDFLMQAVDDPAPISDTLGRLGAIAGIAVPPEEVAAAQTRKAPRALKPELAGAAQGPMRQKGQRSPAPWRLKATAHPETTSRRQATARRKATRSQGAGFEALCLQAREAPGAQVLL